MANKEGGIGFGSIVMGIIFYNIFFGGDDDADDKKVEIVEDERPAITEQVKESIDNLKPEAKEVLSKAKDEFNKIKEELISDEKEKKIKNSIEPEPLITTKTEENSKVIEVDDENDPYGDNNDVY
jgi:hypothetical protein